MTLKEHHPELLEDALRLDKLSCYKFSAKETLAQRIKRWQIVPDNNLFSIIDRGENK